MSQKSPSKSKILAKADLNFVSQQPFEQVIEQLGNLGSRNIKPYVMAVDEDTAVFQLQYLREDDTTAEVSGRLKRWAGNMTHIYCDGRVFRKPKLNSFLRNRAIDAIIVLIFWGSIVQLFYGKGNYSFPLSGYIFTFIYALVGLAVLKSFQLVMKMILETFVPETNQFRHYFNSNPEAKDRERLFHAITSIIRDDDIAKNSVERLEIKPLTEAEEAMLVAQITMQANKQNL